jgi:hypothetical protein
MLQSEPWWQERPAVREGFGLVATITRLDTEGHAALRSAGDAAFAFAFFAFFAQIYVVVAVTLRFLSRNDGFSGRIPHSLKV